MTLKKIITDSESLPRGYAPAYREYSRAVWVCYPAGIHLLVSAAREVYWTAVGTRFGKRRDRIMAETRQEGYNEGRASFVAERLLSDVDFMPINQRGTDRASTGVRR